jgi:alkylation response protein AidB-like acyl-CoA dehydrogenase
MNYDLTQEQQMLKDAAHHFLADECPGTVVREMAENDRGFTEDLWKKMANLGWLGFLFPERYGGCEGSFIDLAVLLYETGYACLPGPFFSTSVLSGLTLIETANDAHKEALMPSIACGDRKVTLAWTECSATFALAGIKTKAISEGNQYIITGTKLFVPYANLSDTLICAVRTDTSCFGEEGLSLFLADRRTPGITVTDLKTMAGDKQCEVTFDQVRIPAQNLLGTLNEAAPVLRKVLLKAAVAQCAVMCGGAQKVLDLAVPYVKERIQFDRPVGSFQAVQHHCANILTYVDTCRFMTYKAAWRISEGLSYEKEASMAKAWASDSYRQTVALAHQVMGGMGFMEEHDLQLYFKQAKAAELSMGDADFHRELVAQQMGL